MDVLKLLEDVKNDKVSLEEAAKELKQLPYEDLGFGQVGSSSAGFVPDSARLYFAVANRMSIC